MAPSQHFRRIPANCRSMWTEATRPESDLIEAYVTYVTR